MQRTAKAVRKKMRALFPKAVELVYDYSRSLVIAYGPTDRAWNALCAIAVYPESVKLYFNRGAEMDDPDGILQGRARIVREVPLDDAKDLDRPAIRRLVRQAIKMSDVPFIRSAVVIKKKR